jgi:2-succinyl-5-enolpyruvyl-6-hydroxy-3-cyclohexene-1-carboxylate synthase
VLRFGGLPTSKMVNEWLADCTEISQIAIAAYPPIPDPYKSATLQIESDLSVACTELAQRLSDQKDADSSYRDQWQGYEHAARAALGSCFTTEGSGSPFEGEIASVLFDAAPDATVFYLSSSMPIRLADMFVSTRSERMRVLVNRGANGIDGMISSAAGAAVALGTPVVLLIGDIAFLHDLNGLHDLAAQNLPVKIILIDNNGGGIFSHLPLAQHTDHFETLIAMPHNLNLKQAGALFGIPVHTTQNAREFRSIYQAALDRPGPEILLVQTDRNTTRELIEQVANKVAVQIREVLRSA